MKILIVKLTSFGDVIHTFPAVSDLRTLRPEVEIDWLVEEAFAPFVALHPGVTTIHSVSFRRLRSPPTRWPLLPVEAVRLGRRLRARRYDLVVDMQGLLKSALPALLAGRGVAGYDADSAREPAASRLYARRIHVPRAMHAVERSRRLLAAAVGYKLPAGQGRYGLAIPLRADSPIDLPARYAMVIHSASWETKLWPEHNWRALLSEIIASGREIVLPWGNAGEKARAERLAVDIEGVNVLPAVLAGADLARVVAGADFAVGLDSGLMHLATALDVPGVWLFGPTDPGLTGPYGRHQTVIASRYSEAPCRRRVCDREPGGRCCMKAVDPYDVVDAVRALMEHPRGT
jgi:lipopolysaccharide heptosyltransferase I